MWPGNGKAESQDVTKGDEDSPSQVWKFIGKDVEASRWEIPGLLARFSTVAGRPVLWVHTRRPWHPDSDDEMLRTPLAAAFTAFQVPRGKYQARCSLTVVLFLFSQLSCSWLTQGKDGIRELLRGSLCTPT